MSPLVEWVSVQNHEITPLNDELGKINVGELLNLSMHEGILSLSVKDKIPTSYFLSDGPNLYLSLCQKIWIN